MISMSCSCAKVTWTMLTDAVCTWGFPIAFSSQLITLVASSTDPPAYRIAGRFPDASTYIAAGLSSMQMAWSLTRMTERLVSCLDRTPIRGQQMMSIHRLRMKLLKRILMRTFSQRVEPRCLDMLRREDMSLRAQLIRR